MWRIRVDETPPRKQSMKKGVTAAAHSEYIRSPYNESPYFAQRSIPPPTAATTTVLAYYWDTNYSQNSTFTSDVASTIASPNSLSSFMSPKYRYDIAQLCSEETLMSILGMMYQYYFIFSYSDHKHRSEAPFFPIEIYILIISF